MHLQKTAGAILFLLTSVFTILSCGEADNTDISEYQSCTEYGEPLYIGKLSDARLTEISGMAFSRKNNGVFYLHNDAGHSAIVYVINTKREVLGTLVFSNLNAEDWEDIAIAKCGDDDCIFIADTGDNSEERDNVSIIKFTEPTIDPDTPFNSMLIEDVESMTLAFLDKPHDVEAMAVDENMSIYLFSKQLGYSAYFRTDGFYHNTEKTPEYVGRIELEEEESVTAADIHPDGLQLLLRTNDSLYEYTFGDKSEINSLTGLSYSSIEAGSDEQGEAVAYNPNSGSIWHTSEAVSDEYPAVYEIRCK